MGLAGGDVGGDLRSGKGEGSFDVGYFGCDFGALSGDQAYAGDDAVGAAGKQAEHPGGIGGVFGFAENLRSSVT